MPVLVLCSGCVTTLGYVPEYPKKEPWGKTPGLLEVRKWALDVLDGYDSRSTANRQAGYAGALLAGAGAASLVGLAAFGGDNAWITGIPIGTAFLAGVAGIYSNEAKAELYAAAANYLQRMINNSGRRELWLKKPKSNANGMLLSRSISEAEKARTKIVKSETEYTTRLAEETSKATATDKSQEQKDAANRAVEDAKRQLDALAIDREIAQRRVESLDNLKDLIERQDSITSNIGAFEALCLRDDVMDVMERVDRLINLLMPSDVIESLKAVGTTTGKSRGDWVARQDIAQANKDLVYLTSPIVSECGVL